MPVKKFSDMWGRFLAGTSTKARFFLLVDLRDFFFLDLVSGGGGGGGGLGTKKN